MDAPIDLVPLNCTRCATPLAAEPNEFVWACGQCGQGLALHDEKGLLPLELNYHADLKPQVHGWPFWVGLAQVSVRRDSTGFRRSHGEANEFWAQPRQFFIPAYDAEIDILIQVAGQLLRNPRPLTPAPADTRHPFAPITLPHSDVRSLAEYLVVAIEAERKDKIESVQYSLDMKQVDLWILPGG
jgi:hypothetical protein